jgi:hypothetical protein
MEITQKNTAPNWWKMIGWMAIVVAVGSLLIAVITSRGLQENKQKMEALSAQNLKNEHIITVMSIEQDRLIAIQGVLQAKGVQQVVMQGTSLDPTSSVRLMWLPENKSAVMLADHIAVPAPNSQYQLWAMTSGKPINLGVFDYDELDRMTEPFEVNANHVDAFIMTIEQKGGRPNPTLEKTIVKGQVGAFSDQHN